MFFRKPWHSLLGLDSVSKWYRRLLLSVPKKNLLSSFCLCSVFLNALKKVGTKSLVLLLSGSFNFSKMDKDLMCPPAWIFFKEIGSKELLALDSYLSCLFLLI